MRVQEGGLTGDFSVTVAGTAEEEGGAVGWGQPVSEGRGRVRDWASAADRWGWPRVLAQRARARGRLAGKWSRCVSGGARLRAERRAGRAGVGPGEREGKERADRAGKLGRGVGCWAVFLGWAGLLKGLGFLFPILFYFKHHSNYLNSNSNLNSTLALKQIKQCISMNATTNFKLRQNFNNL